MLLVKDYFPSVSIKQTYAEVKEEYLVIILG